MLWGLLPALFNPVFLFLTPSIFLLYGLVGLVGVFLYTARGKPGEFQPPPWIPWMLFAPFTLVKIPGPPIICPSVGATSVMVLPRICICHL